MFEFLAEKITQVLETKNIIVRDRAIYKYGIETWISALASILLLLVVGIIFNCILEVIIYEAVFFILRRFTGGYYCTTHFECMSLYIAIFTLYMVLREYLKVSIVMVCIAIAISLIIIISLSPVQSNDQQLTELEQRKYHLYSTLLSIIIGISCIVLRFLNIPVYSILTYSFSLLAILMLGGKVVNRRSWLPLQINLFKYL